MSHRIRRQRSGSAARLLAAAALEELHVLFMLFGGLPGLERAEIAAFARLRILLARVEPPAARLELADHRAAACLRRVTQPLRAAADRCSHEPDLCARPPREEETCVSGLPRPEPD